MVAAEVRARIAHNPNPLVVWADFSDLPRGATGSCLARLVREGVLQHVRRGVYVRVGHEVSPYAYLYAHARSTVYPVGQEAVHQLGLGPSPAIAGYATIAGERFALPWPQVRLRRRVPRRRARLMAREAGLCDVLGRLEHYRLSGDPTEPLVAFLRGPGRLTRLRAAAAGETLRCQARLTYLGALADGDAPTATGNLGPLAPQLVLPFEAGENAPAHPPWG